MSKTICRARKTGQIKRRGKAALSGLMITTRHNIIVSDI